MLKMVLKALIPDLRQILINKSDLPERYTPLHYSVLIHGQEITKLLLDYGADKSLFKLNSPCNCLMTENR